MSIPKKTLAQVKRKIYAARAEEVSQALEAGELEKLEQLNGPTKREQMNQARLAARQVFDERHGRKPRVEKLSEYVAPVNVQKEFQLSEGELVTLSKNATGFRLGVEVNPYIVLQKGDIGVLVHREALGTGTGRVGRRGTPLAHVMMSGSIVELPLAVLRAAAEA